MLKRTICALAAIVALTLRAAELEDFPFGTRLLNGGAVVPVDMNMVQSCNEHLNFCFAHRFADGTIRLGHSMGVHTVTERGCTDYSIDDGKTWQRTPSGLVGGFNAYDTLDGRKASVGCWVMKELDEHVITRTIEDADGKVVTEKSTLKLPFKSWCQMHRNVLRCKDGRLVMPVKGHKEGHNKWMAFMVESLDDGKTWQYVSTILEDLEGKYAEGPNEADLIELANGDLLAYVRVASTAPLHQLRSKDRGRTWGDEKEIAPFGVAPSSIMLQNGTIVVVTGRPCTYLLIDFTGTGEHYQQYTVFNGSGSSYASVLEIAPNRVLVIYDESDFGGWRSPAVMARISALTLDIVKDDSLLVDKSKTMGYEVFYSPKDGKLPGILRGFQTGGYNKQGTSLTVEKIAERPDPVLRFEHHGQNDLRWPNITNAISEHATKIRVEVQLRLNDLGEKAAQFQCRFAMQDPDPRAKAGAAIFGQVRFANEALLCIVKSDKGSFTTRRFPFAFNNAFHTFVIEGNTKDGTYKVYADGQKEPVAIGEFAPHPEIGVGFQFGDGASDVQGVADLAYIGYTAE